jgi:hypothetical protein
MTIIDAHAHYHPRRFVEALQRMGVNQGPMAPHPDTDEREHVERRLQMIEPGELRVLSASAGLRQ